MTDNPKISIIMPTMNRADCIKTVLDYIRNQSVQNWELLIADGNSTDGTSAICMDYERNDSRIHHLRLSETQRRFINRLIKMARGEYVIVMCDDDIYEPSFLSKLSAMLDNNPHAVLAWCSHDEIYGDKVTDPVRRWINNYRTTFESLCYFVQRDDYISQFGLWRRSALKHGYLPSLHPLIKLSDFCMVFAGLLNGPAIYTDNVLYHKVDSGLANAKMRGITALNARTCGMILRYMFLPVAFWGDLCLATMLVTGSNLSAGQKLKVSGLLWLWLVKKHWSWFCNIANGIGVVMFRMNTENRKESSLAGVLK